MEEEGKQHATASLQALERLNLNSRNLPSSESNSQLKDKVHTALDHLREIKARLEGCGDDFVPLSVAEKPLVALKQLLLMHIPASITDTARSQFSQLIQQALSGRCKKVLAAVVLTCPWYEATQKERGEQAKHNTLLVIVVSEDRQFFCPANPQVKEQGGAVDLGWLSVLELFHFAHLLVKGRTKHVEAALCDSQAVVYSTEEWQRLREVLSASSVTGMRCFLEACVNQAVSGVGKKRKNGDMKLAGTATIADMCGSFRLLHHAHNHHLGLPPVSNGLTPSGLPDVASQALGKLRALYKEPDAAKEDIFQCLMKWHQQLKEKMKTCVFVDQKGVTEVVGGWMMEVRLQGRVLLPSAASVVATEQEGGDSNPRLKQLMAEIGGPLGRLAPEQVLLVARAGSWMYGLSTPDSDVDYVVIFRERTETILSACSRVSECVESRGPSRHVEYGAYEARLLCDMLLKGSVVILELVYLGEHEYVSPVWEHLHKHRGRFVTEVAVQQYLGLIKNNLHSLHSHRHCGNTARERKLFYQIFHKIDSVRHMMTGVAPPVRVTGPVRDFIMDVRTKPLEGDLSRESLLEKASADFEDLRRQLADRESRLPERPDFRFVTDWLLSVRGDNFS
ncbi:uncharacterized protein LOC143277875 [Babylonia areolata]|uniref:uncharacterized protein LOC143277875 n=1 Tax=Babylonia areolata TaxID=304850 RepID=UPI003FD37357